MNIKNQFKKLITAILMLPKQLAILVLGLMLLCFQLVSQFFATHIGDDSGESAVAVIVGTLVMVMLGLMLYAQFSAQTDDIMDSGSLANNTEAQAAYSSVKTSGWGAFNLISISPWVMAAVTLLGIVSAFGGGSRN